MTRYRRGVSGEEGFAVVYMAVILTGLLLFTGLAVDSGRGYIVKAQLSKAVDGAALGAARALNSGNPRAEATAIFKANFPLGYFGTDVSPDPTAAADFFTLTTDSTTGVNTVTVTANSSLPTTFMRLASLTKMDVKSSGQATRRMVDLTLVLDVSSSIGSKWNAVRDSARTFVNSFDANSDRVALVTFGNGARVVDAMRSTRGFNKVQVKADIPNTLPGGSTNMVEGLYRGWDEIRSVPTGTQSGLRVIVLFTDGASNSVPGIWPGSATESRSLRTFDFPDNGADPDSQTHARPNITGLYDSELGTTYPIGPPTGYSLQVPNWDSPCGVMATPYNLTQGCVTQVPLMPAGTVSTHTHHRSGGIPTSFDLQSSTLKVNGVPQNSPSRRGLRNFNGTRYPADVWNINNSARNLVEIIANAARSDAGGDYPIRIYSIGMGELVRYDLGTMPETSESILMRIANDTRSPDFNAAQTEGKYYFAATESDVGPAFQALQNQIIRLTK
jgi:Flp pilus assembly protein TadG